MIPQAIKKEFVDGYYSPELAPSPNIMMTMNEIVTNPQHPDATLSVNSEVKD